MVFMGMICRFAGSFAPVRARKAEQFRPEVLDGNPTTVAKWSPQSHFAPMVMRSGGQRNLRDGSRGATTRFANANARECI